MIRDCPKPRQGKQRGRGRGRGQQRSHSHKANVSETSAQNNSDVLPVPDLKQNLYSVKSATDRGMIIQFGHTRAWVKNKIGQTHAMGTRVGELYYLDLDSSYHRANLAS